MAKIMRIGKSAIIRKTFMKRRRGKNAPCAGFAYVLLLILVAILGLVAANTISAGSVLARRDAEAELFAIGAEFEMALRSYAGAGNATAAATARGPQTLEELLKDPRSPGIRRHLRQIYADPLTGKAEWGLVKDQSGWIVGVYSLADGVPIKQEGFDVRQAGFAQAQSYRQWVFGLPGAGAFVGRVQ
jgi:type II secretory pathway pseudopilin PulG